jgi:hypothetical protein
LQFSNDAKRNKLAFRASCRQHEQLPMTSGVLGVI